MENMINLEKFAEGALSEKFNAELKKLLKILRIQIQILKRKES